MVLYNYGSNVILSYNDYEILSRPRIRVIKSCMYLYNNTIMVTFSIICYVIATCVIYIYLYMTVYNVSIEGQVYQQKNEMF